MIQRCAVLLAMCVPLLGVSACTTVADRGLKDPAKPVSSTKKSSATTSAGGSSNSADSAWLQAPTSPVTKALTPTAQLCSPEVASTVLDCGVATVSSPVGPRCPETTASSIDRARCEPAALRSSAQRFGWMLSAQRGQTPTLSILFGDDTTMKEVFRAADTSAAVEVSVCPHDVDGNGTVDAVIIHRQQDRVGVAIVDVISFEPVLKRYGPSSVSTNLVRGEGCAAPPIAVMRLTPEGSIDFPTAARS